MRPKNLASMLFAAVLALALAACNSDSNSLPAPSTGGNGGNTNTTPVSIQQTQISDAVVGQSYGIQFLGLGGRTPYAFALVDGSTLPQGFTLDANGVLSGTPTTAGTFNVAVQIVDSSTPALSAARTYQLNISDVSGVRIDNTDLEPSVIGQTYAAADPLVGAGGAAPYSFEVIGGIAAGGGTIVPGTGVQLNSDGTWQGQQAFGTTSFSVSFDVRVTDNNSDSAVFPMRLDFVPTPTVAGSTLEDAIVGSFYNEDLAEGLDLGAATMSWQVTGGTLPPGLSFVGSSLRGAPSVSGLYAFNAVPVLNAEPAPTLSTVIFTVAVLAEVGYQYTADARDVAASNNDAASASSLGTMPQSGTLNVSEVFSTSEDDPGTTGTDESDVDFYSFTLQTRAQLTVSAIYNDALANLRLTLYPVSDPSSSVSGTVRSSSTNRASISTVDLAAGDYLVEVEAVPAGFNPPQGDMTEYLLEFDVNALVIADSRIELDLNAGGTTLNHALSLYSAGNLATGANWTITDGELPTGVSLTIDGIITGTPFDFGVFRFAVRADLNGNVAERTLQLKVVDSAAGNYWETMSEIGVYAPGAPGGFGGPYAAFAEAMVTAPHPDYADEAAYVLGGLSLINFQSSDDLLVYHTDDYQGADAANRIGKVEPMTGSEMPEARTYLGAAYLQHSYGGFIYAIGGEVGTPSNPHSSTGMTRSVIRLQVADGSGDALSSFGTWQTVQELPAVHPDSGLDLQGWGHLGIAVNDTANDSTDRIYAVGGRMRVEEDPTGNPELFTTRLNEWVLTYQVPTTLAGMGSWIVSNDKGYTPRRGPAAAYIDGAIYIVGGRENSGDRSDYIEMYRPNPADEASLLETADRTNFPRLVEGMYYPLYDTEDGSLYIVGGWDASAIPVGTDWVQRFTPTGSGDTGTIEQLAQTDYGTGFSSGTFANGHFYVLGSISHAPDLDPVPIRYHK